MAALNARRAWEDLCLAADLLEQEQDPDRFRILWVSCITLARAIGHILDKNDGSDVKRISRILFKEWNDEHTKAHIFTDFIEKDRNLLLKQYSYDYVDEGLFLDGDDCVLAPIDGDLYKPIAKGAFAGWDCLDLLQEAITWWDKQLKIIEGQIEP